MMKAKLAIAALLLVSSAGTALANTDPAIRKKGQESVRETTFGKMTDKFVDPGDDAFMGMEATFEDGGKMSVKAKGMDDPMVGFWIWPKGEQECATARGGSKYWGKISFQLSEFGRVLTGKWGYCDKEPDQDFKAEWKKP
jgi:hypothetical protein